LFNYTEADDMRISDVGSDMSTFFTSMFLFLESRIKESSSVVTESDKLAINEIFQILVESQVPAGNNSIRVICGEFSAS
jgi:hypothetical protein